MGVRRYPAEGFHQGESVPTNDADHSGCPQLPPRLPPTVGVHDCLIPQCVRGGRPPVGRRCAECGDGCPAGAECRVGCRAVPSSRCHQWVRWVSTNGGCSRRVADHYCGSSLKASGCPRTTSTDDHLHGRPGRPTAAVGALPDRGPWNRKWTQIGVPGPRGPQWVSTIGGHPRLGFTGTTSLMAMNLLNLRNELGSNGLQPRRCVAGSHRSLNAHRCWRAQRRKQPLGWRILDRRRRPHPAHTSRTAAPRVQTNLSIMENRAVFWFPSPPLQLAEPFPDTLAPCAVSGKRVPAGSDAITLLSPTSQERLGSTSRN